MTELPRSTGAHAALAALADSGVSVCFANPGTTELDLVRAFEGMPAIRCVLGLQENVCTGAADGWGRMTGRCASTLLHLGPGFANGIANLHNARRARTPIVNLIGDQTSWHLPFDAPLTSDIESLARPVSGWVRRVARTADMARDARDAVAATRQAGGQIATLILPADFQAEALPAGADVPTAGSAGAGVPPAFDLAAAAAALRASRRPVLLLGGGGERSALGAAGQRAAARLCAHLGAQAYAETFPARAERGRGLPAFDRLPYFPEAARAVLDPADRVFLVGALAPITYFGYPGQPSRLVEPERLQVLAEPGDDAASRLEALADALGAPPWQPPAALPRPEAPAGTLTPAKVAAALTLALPEDAIVSVEGGTCGYPFYTVSAAAPRHTALTNTGGAIGQGLPVALGAALACPQRRVVALVSDGSTQYTVQALWSMAHEQTDITVLVAANHQYGILRQELRRAGALSAQSEQLTALDRPRIDWVRLSESYGVPARRVDSAEALAAALAESFGRRGPALVEMSL